MLLRCGLCVVAVVAMMGCRSGEQTAAPGAQVNARPTPPTRDPHTAGYVEAKELPDGEVPPADTDGNFIIGPTHMAGAGDARSDPRRSCRRAR